MLTEIFLKDNEFRYIREVIKPRLKTEENQYPISYEQGKAEQIPADFSSDQNFSYDRELSVKEFYPEIFQSLAPVTVALFTLWSRFWNLDIL